MTISHYALLYCIGLLMFRAVWPQEFVPFESLGQLITVFLAPLTLPSCQLLLFSAVSIFVCGRPPSHIYASVANLLRVYNHELGLLRIVEVKMPVNDIRGLY